MSHPEQSTSRKVTALSDFEFRVFEQVKLSSDDFGVMPYSATVLRADNLRLRKATEKQVFDALKALVAAVLLLVFDHQGESYVCAPVWQTWQQVRFPRKTSRPKPDGAVLKKCDEETQELFRQHPGGRPPSSRKASGQIPEKSRTPPGIIPDSDGSKLGRSDAEVPANANADANANAHANANASAPETLQPGSAPLIVNTLQFEKAKKNFAFYGSRLRVPHVLHDELRTKLGGTEPHQRLMDWYLLVNTDAELAATPILEVFTFLRPKFLEWAASAVMDAEIEKFRPKPKEA